MRKCAEPTPSRPTTWTPTISLLRTLISTAGRRSQRRGLREGRAVGGLYGVSHRGLLGGESMSIAAPMPRRLRSYILCSPAPAWFRSARWQVPTPIWRSWARPEIPRDEFLARLQQAIALQVGSDLPQGMVGYHAPSCPAAECLSTRVGARRLRRRRTIAGGFGEAERAERGGVGVWAKAEPTL